MKERWKPDVESGYTVGRNARCRCGSGKKYKRCCLRNAGSRNADAIAKASAATDNDAFVSFAYHETCLNSPQPKFERALYVASSDQARFLKRMCATAGRVALGFGQRTWSAALQKLSGSEVPAGDARGLVLGFHGKALEELGGVRALTAAACISGAMGSVRVLFEILVYQGYVLKEDTEKRVLSYRDAGMAEALKINRQLIVKGTSGDWIGSLVEGACELLPDGAERRPRHWASANVEELASQLGVGHLYAALYRLSSGVLHARDADAYNPIMMSARLHHHEPEQPYFVTRYGVLSAQDAFALSFFADFVPLWIFAKTAEYFTVDLSEPDRELASIALQVLKRSRLGSLEDLQEHFPEIFRNSSERSAQDVK